MSDISWRSKIFIVPGLGNSGEDHWQTHWEKQFGFARIQQQDWHTPIRQEWVESLNKGLLPYADAEILLVGHSMACSTIVFWSQQYQRKIKGALLIAPCDTEADMYPPGTVGFKPMPLTKLPFPSFTITSSDDPYVSLERATVFANAWGSDLINIGPAGHINIASGHGPWYDGLKFLKQLDQL